MAIDAHAIPAADEGVSGSTGTTAGSGIPAWFGKTWTPGATSDSDRPGRSAKSYPTGSNGPQHEGQIRSFRVSSGDSSAGISVRERG